jgi:hypothetical protein
MRFLTSILHHGSKLPLIEGFPGATCDAQFEKKGPARFEPYRGSNQYENRCEERESQERHDYVECPLDR